MLNSGQFAGEKANPYKSLIFAKTMTSSVVAGHQSVYNDYTKPSCPKIVCLKHLVLFNIIMFP